MRKQFYLTGIALLAAGTLLSCSNENEPASGNTESAGFIAVNILAPNSNVTRATDGGFVNGTDSEGKADKGIFLLFDAAGNQVGQPQELTLTPWAGPGNPNVENMSSAVLVVENQKNITTTHVLAILNAPAGADFAGKTLTQVIDLTGDYSSTANGFVMTNSVYNEGGNTVTATPIAEHIAASAEAAKNNPVEIYVERVLSKVQTSVLSNVEGSTITVSGQSVTVKPEIVGIEVANVAKNSNLVKDIAGINFSWTWNDPANKRSYWATTSNTEFGNQSWNTIGSTSAASAQHFYVQENTGDTKTSVLVTGRLKDENDEALSFVKYAGQFYTPAGAMNIMANVLKNAGYRINNGTESVTIAPEQLKWAQPAGIESWQTVAQLATAEGTVFTKNGETVSAAEINTFLTGNAYRVKFWNDGMAYWYVNIEHFGKDAAGNALNGIVRNHVYDLSLNSLKGLGVPVFDPDREIIPDTPVDEDGFYIAARINILKWKVVSQDVNFE